MIGLFKGLATTLSTFTRRPVTIEYPDEKHVLPVRQRSFPVLTWDFDHDEPFCTGCNVCIRNCPVDCMTATMQDNPNYSAGTSDRRKIVEKFWIDYARCMRCNICVEVCPFEAIVMDNNWTGHEHAAYDRRDLHMDIDDLTRPSRTGQLVNPFRPQDRIDLIERQVAGQEAPEETFKGAKPLARQQQMERIAKGEGPAIRLRPPEAPKAPARAAGAGGAAAAARSILTDAEGNPLSSNKIRAKRMRAERAAKEAQAAGEAIPADVMEVLVAVGSSMAPPEARAAAAAGGPAPAAGRAASPILTDAEGNPLSDNKIRAMRMRAERGAKAALEAGQPIPPEIMEVLVATNSEMAPPEARAAAAAPAAAAPAATPLLDAEGNPLSENKVRAMRMRAERAAKAALDAGQEIPAETMDILVRTGSSMAPAPAAAPAAGGAPAAVLAPPTDAEGNPLSENKARAMRMRAERNAREFLARGEAIPADVVATIQSLGGTVPTEA